MGFTLNTAFDRIKMPRYAQELLIACYNQEHRAYHNLDHIQEMLRQLPEELSEVEIAIEAILFHDIVYASTPQAAGLNEALSIAEYLFYNTKTLAYDTPFGKNGDGSLEYERRVIEAINATAYHLVDQKNISSTTQIVLDLDLSTIARPWEEYLSWQDKVTQENKIIYGESAAIRGAQDFLSKLLQRDKLYYLHTQGEQQARSNIHSYIERLRS